MAPVERQLLDAARTLLAEGGVKSLTIEGVSALTGIAKTTIYRRWRSKEDLALAVVLQMTRDVVEVDVDGDLRAQLISILDRAVTILRTTLMGSVMKGLASDLATNRDLGKEYHDKVVSLRVARIRNLVQLAVERGEISGDVDVDLIHDLMFGPVYHRLLLSGQELDEGLATRIVDAVLPGVVTPAARTTTGPRRTSAGS